jgi:hypothetical protein
MALTPRNSTALPKTPRGPETMHRISWRGKSLQSRSMPFSAGLPNLLGVESFRGQGRMSFRSAVETTSSFEDLPPGKGETYIKRPSSVFSSTLDGQPYQSIFIPNTSFILNPNHFVYNSWWWFIVLLTYWNLLQVRQHASCPTPNIVPTLCILLSWLPSLFGTGGNVGRPFSKLSIVLLMFLH